MWRALYRKMPGGLSAVLSDFLVRYVTPMPLLRSATQVVAQGYGERKGKLDHDLRPNQVLGHGPLGKEERTEKTSIKSRVCCLLELINLSPSPFWSTHLRSSKKVFCSKFYFQLPKPIPKCNSVRSSFSSLSPSLMRPLFPRAVLL